MLERLLPDFDTVRSVAPLALLITMAAALLVGWLRIQRNVRAPYTRKTFHFIIITAAVLVQLRWGLHGVVVYSAIVALAVLFAAWRGPGFAFYEALARPSDAPHGTLFILVPLATTALGGLLTNLLFPAWAHVGYFVVAWGDAIGEPVGARWGRHRYQVPSLAGLAATRTIEGSTAVAITSAAAAFAALALSGVATAPAIVTACVIGIATALVEAVSHHGVDNLTIQLASSALAAVLTGWLGVS